MELPGFYSGGGYFGAGNFSPETRLGDQHFTVDDLLDFPTDDALMADGFFNNVSNSADSSAVTPVDSCNSSVSGGDVPFSAGITHFSGDLCVPYDDMEELEWLSNFVEDSFSTGEDMRALHLVAGAKPPTPESSCSESATHIFRSETPLPVKARSKRSRAAPCDWSTRVLHLAADSKPPQPRNRDGGESSGRKCVHCLTEKTPQWRTGPMGPKTLCNACGVRYKSGRLVAEYRPAASPTFLSTRHSNSHRKVLELRRQKETQIAHVLELRRQKETQIAHHHQHFISQSQSSIFNGADGYLIHHPDYSHMI